MNRKIITTLDGSTTVYLEDVNESYHSQNGAIQEAQHVFIKNGLDLVTKSELAILEIGFGTGLNAFISLLEAEKRNQKIRYVGVEAYPVANEEVIQLNYAAQLNASSSLFLKLHANSWNEFHDLTEFFSLNKRQQFFNDITDENVFDLIYFDAFGFPTQPDLWSEIIFKKMFLALKPKGILVTYACRTIIKNNMIAAGFTIEKLPGAPGKREMLRATKQ